MPVLTTLSVADLMEHAIEENRRRTKVIARFFTEQACLKLVFSTLCQTNQRWRRVTMTKREQQLALLRRELGLPAYLGQEVCMDC